MNRSEISSLHLLAVLSVWIVLLRNEEENNTLDELDTEQIHNGKVYEVPINTAIGINRNASVPNTQQPEGFLSPNAR